MSYGIKRDSVRTTVRVAVSVFESWLVVLEGLSAVGAFAAIGGVGLTSTLWCVLALADAGFCIKTMAITVRNMRFRDIAESSGQVQLLS